MFAICTCSVQVWSAFHHTVAFALHARPHSLPNLQQPFSACEPFPDSAFAVHPLYLSFAPLTPTVEIRPHRMNTTPPIAMFPYQSKVVPGWYKFLQTQSVIHSTRRKWNIISVAILARAISSSARFPYPVSSMTLVWGVAHGGAPPQHPSSAAQPQPLRSGQLCDSIFSPMHSSPSHCNRHVPTFCLVAVPPTEDVSAAGCRLQQP